MSSPFFWFWDENRKLKIAKVYNALRAKQPQRLRKKDTRSLRNLRKDWRVSSIPSGSRMYDACVLEWEKNEGWR